MESPNHSGATLLGHGCNAAVGAHCVVELLTQNALDKTKVDKTQRQPFLRR